MNAFEQRFAKLREDMEALNRAREALDLDTKRDDRLAPKLEGVSCKRRMCRCIFNFSLTRVELQDLKGTWMELSKVHNAISELKATPWSGFVAKKTRSTIQVLTISHSLHARNGSRNPTH